MKKYILLPALVLWICATPAYAITVTCTNCSTNLIQLLDRITNVEQLTNAIKQYQEAVEQTRQQITMVQQNIEQYQNMLQNTAQLPANLVNELKGSLDPAGQPFQHAQNATRRYCRPWRDIHLAVSGAGALRHSGRSQPGTDERSPPALPPGMGQVGEIR